MIIILWTRSRGPCIRGGGPSAINPAAASRRDHLHSVQRRQNSPAQHWPRQKWVRAACCGLPSLASTPSDKDGRHQRQGQRLRSRGQPEKLRRPTPPSKQAAGNASRLWGWEATPPPLHRARARRHPRCHPSTAASFLASRPSIDRRVAGAPHAPANASKRGCCPNASLQVPVNWIRTHEKGGSEVWWVRALGERRASLRPGAATAISQTRR